MKLVIGPDVAMWLAEQRGKVPAHHKLLAPTLLRSQVLAWCYAQVQAGQLSRKEADARLDYLRGLQIRLLGDRVLQHTAWAMAQELGWTDTFVAEYLALTKLQAEALVTRNGQVADAAKRLVRVVPPETLLQ
jgi:predicted nucleic acid-binding protein